MASGETLFVFTPHSVDLPTSGGVPHPDARNIHPTLRFDAAVAQILNLPIFMPRNYTGLGTTATLVWSAVTASIGVTRWTLAWERHQDDIFNFDVDSFAAAQAVNDTTGTSSGEPSYASIPFTDGGQMDNIQVGESGRLQLIRDAPNAADTMAGFAEWERLEIRET